MSTEITEVRTIEVITAEIRALTASALANIIEIGRRLTEAKEMLPYGEFGAWLESVGYSHSTANNFMRLFEAYGSKQGSLFGAEVENFQTFGKLSYSKALALLDVPAEERESFAKENDLEAMSTRELKAAIKERDEARAELEASEKLRAEMADRGAGLKAELDAAKMKVRELESRPVEVAVQEPGPAEIEKAVKAAVEAETEKLKKKLDAAEKAKKKAEDAKAAAETAAKNAAEKKSAESSAELERYKAEAGKLAAETEELRKKLKTSGEAVATFKVHFETWQRAYADMTAALERTDGEISEKLRAAVDAVIDRWKGEGK